MSKLQERVTNTFHYLHEHAEISWEETETTKYIASILRDHGCNVTTFDDCTGVIGEYGNFNTNLPVVAIRADMDALWQEVNGKFQANHSCGHDAHMAMVLGLLWKLEENPSLKSNIAIKFIFQPAEEKGAGALKMVEKGGLDRVDYLFGIHLRPYEETAMGHATPVIIHGATTVYKEEICGHDAHAARPHLNVNAIEVIAEIVNLLSNIHLNPRIPHSVKMTNVRAGGKSTNIIPGRATFAIDMRAQDNQVMDELEKKVEEILEAMNRLYNVKVAITHKEKIPAAETNEEAIQIMEKAAASVLGREYVDPPLVTPGGDDFHFYTIKRPDLKATMLGLGCDLKPGLHHPNMTFDENALMNGVAILYAAVKEVYGV
ncbi:M20 peptidase aminoacylase family protein [Virgibacillus sp. SK37]|uniref:M20 peptidase aminoacylase family protein n=1 Tax=Virgibacillus sp. SK37 TaxID=403957 RepID=UPI0004D160D4|nr:M20 peptidase aminoacylase family protein [Virgibacillus sp. SK37]AIF42866.1 amidohydrolase [Virgibacillus sp. SK37]